MQELYNFFNSCGFSVSEITPDGKMHRFKIDGNDSKNSGWYIFFQNHSTRNGLNYFVGIVGNWKTGDQFDYQSNIALGREDKDLIKKKIAQAKRKAENEKKRMQDETRGFVSNLWDELKEGRSRYHDNKKLSKSYGSRIKDDFISGVIAHIPMRDIDGTLWNVQKIFEDGKKRFSYGGKIDGCFYEIGNMLQEKELYLCEGFATAASINESTGKTAICTFTAHNLIGCAKDIKRRYPDKSIIICADTDEAGQEKATEAAKVTLSPIITPQFKDPEGKTDFNDLMISEGKEEVKKQILKVKPDKRYVIALGYFKDHYYFVSSVNQQIQKMSASGIANSGLLRLQPLEYWETLYPGQKTNVNWTQASSDMIEKCHRKGVFRPDRIRGRGVWIDESRVVYHMGNRLWVNGEVFGLHEINSRYIYDQDEIMPEIHATPLAVEEARKLLDVALLLNWKRPDTDPVLFSGWVVIAPICGALPWRPHVWLSGSSGTGKSYTLNEIIKPILSRTSHFFSGQTTEAGVRQTTGVSSLPVIFDEFETNDEQSANRVKQVLELARQASSDSEAIVAKGGAGGEAMQFKPRFSMIASSVRSNLQHEEDRNRFCLLELKRHSAIDNVENFARIKTHTAMLQSEFGLRLFSRSIRMLPTILKSIETLQGAFGSKYTMRLGQQVSSLIAGYWSIVSDEPITEGEAKAFSEQLEVVDEVQTDKDEINCLNHLVEKVLTIESETGSLFRISILEMLNDELKRFVSSLERYGISYDDQFIYIALNHSELKKDIFGKTKWENNYSRVLARLNGAIYNKQKWFSHIKRNTKCVKIPKSLMISSF